ncbi:MAG: ATP-binding protein [Endomicrobiales bacterium]
MNKDFDSCKQLLEAVPEIIVALDVDRTVMFINNKGCEVTGCSREEIVGTDGLTYMAVERGREAAEKFYQNFMDGFDSQDYFESIISTKSRGERRIGWHCSRLYAGETKIPCFMCAGLDITESRRAEDELRTLNRELKQRLDKCTTDLEKAHKEQELFSYSVSHDLHAPLRSIRGFVEILMEDYGKKFDDEGRKLTKKITDSTTRMGQLIDDLLLFSRLSRHEITHLTVHIDALATAVFKEQQLLHPGRSIECTVQPIAETKADPSMLAQVMINLLSNAIKYTQTRQTAVIEVGSINRDGETVYYVKDNGVGFDMTYVNKIFNVFQRLHSSSQFEGTGIGLAIVRRIVEKHGGRVWAQSTINEGSTFFFTLKEAPPHPEESPSDRTGNSEVSATSKPAPINIPGTPGLSQTSLNDKISVSKEGL